MSPFYGSKEPPNTDVVPDWLMGGNRKRRVLASLADPDREQGWTVTELVEELGCGRSTAFEIVRGLRSLDVLVARDGRIRLDLETQLGAAIAGILTALEPFATRPVDRPPAAWPGLASTLHQPRRFARHHGPQRTREKVSGQRVVASWRYRAWLSGWIRWQGSMGHEQVPNEHETFRATGQFSAPAAG